MKATGLGVAVATTWIGVARTGVRRYFTAHSALYGAEFELLPGNEPADLPATEPRRFPAVVVTTGDVPSAAAS